MVPACCWVRLSLRQVQAGAPVSQYRRCGGAGDRGERATGPNVLQGKPGGASSVVQRVCLQGRCLRGQAGSGRDDSGEMTSATTGALGGRPKDSATTGVTWRG